MSLSQQQPSKLGNCYNPQFVSINLCILFEIYAAKCFVSKPSQTKLNLHLSQPKTGVFRNVPAYSKYCLPSI